MEPIANHQVAKAYEDAPAYVRDYIGEGRLAAFVATIASRYSLTREMRQRLSVACRDSLLKLIGPEEFEKNILLLGTSREAELSIAEDFREAMKIVISPPPTPENSVEKVSEALSGEVLSPGPVVQEKPPIVSAPPVATRVLAPTPAYVPTPPTPVTPILEPKPLAAPVPRAVVTPTPTPGPIPVSLPPVPEAPRPIPTPEPVPAPPPQPIRPRTMASDVEALQTPGQVPARAPALPPRLVSTPAPQAFVPMAEPKAVSQAPKPVPPVPNASAIHEDLKKYGVDPYREPVE
jgi:hypothetical protein